MKNMSTTRQQNRAIYVRHLQTEHLKPDNSQKADPLLIDEGREYAATICDSWKNATEHKTIHGLNSVNLIVTTPTKRTLESLDLFIAHHSLSAESLPTIIIDPRIREQYLGDFSAGSTRGVLEKWIDDNLSETLKTRIDLSNLQDNWAPIRIEGNNETKDRAKNAISSYYTQDDPPQTVMFLMHSTFYQTYSIYQETMLTSATSLKQCLLIIILLSMILHTTMMKTVQ